MVLVHLNRRGLVFFPFWILLVFFCVLLAFFCVIEHQKNARRTPEEHQKNPEEPTEGEEHEKKNVTSPGFIRRDLGVLSNGTEG